ncbi:uncharacterized protein LOC111055944 isoform X2 [Nilaparvata lugens]|uniref:uncharacterized protein LOC111055944 isoform X2 n=1 Tax=Nilaparvata lugens TaxID=108931 RepID=UPI00193CE5BE|nr:uncharacterized protein LOC111055944 isoform X2 [Nilaparvata lugens]
MMYSVIVVSTLAVMLALFTVQVSSKPSRIELQQNIIITDDEKDVPVPENLDMMSAMLESIIGSKDIMQIPDADPEGLDNLKERCIFGTRVCNLHCVAKGKRYGRCVHGRCVCY